MHRVNREQYASRFQGSTIILILIAIITISMLVVGLKLIPTPAPSSETFGLDNWILLHVFEVLGFVALSMSIVHSLRVYGKEQTIIFFPSCFLYGLLLELPFSSYNQNAWIKVGPYGSMLAVVAGWCVVNYALFFISRKINCSLSIIGRGVLSGLIGITIDLPLDPIAFAYGLWYWEPIFFGYPIATTFYGVPVINFINWFYTISLFIMFQGYLERSVYTLKTKFLISILAIPLLAVAVLVISYTTVYVMFLLGV